MAFGKLADFKLSRNVQESRIMMAAWNRSGFQGFIGQMIRVSYDMTITSQANTANGDQPSKRGDGIHDFLFVLSQIYSVHPNLWQDPSPR